MKIALTNQSKWRLSQDDDPSAFLCDVSRVSRLGLILESSYRDYCHMTNKLQSARRQSSNERSAHRGRVIILFALKDEANEIKRGEGS